VSKKETIRKALLIREEENLKELVSLASKVIGITENGDILLKIQGKEISLKEKILLLLIGKKFAHEAELSDDCVITLDEISRNLNADKKISSARISELVRERKVRFKDRGKYEVVFYDIKSFLENIISKHI